MDSPGGSFFTSDSSATAKAVALICEDEAAPFLLIAQLAERGIVVMINSLLYQSSPSRWFNSGSEEFGSRWSDSSVG